MAAAIGVGFLLAAGVDAPSAQTPRQRATPSRPVGVEVSPVVTWRPYGADGVPTRRRLTASEMALARERAGKVHAAMQASASFTQPIDVATLVTSDAFIGDEGRLQQDFLAYWSRPMDTTRRPDGAIAPKLGGAHHLLYIEANVTPRADSLATRDPLTSDFNRGEDAAAGVAAAFPFPPVVAEFAGGQVYADYVVFTPDGRSVLEPAPVGPLLEAEIARVGRVVAQSDTSASLRQLDATMTPEAKAARRARRAEVWARETKDPAAMQRRLDAAERSDDSAYERDRARLVPPVEGSAAARDPRNPLAAPRLALQQLQERLASLDAAGRAAPACGRRDTAFPTHLQVRFEPMVDSSPVRGCVPMARVRTDLFDRRLPSTAVQVLTVWTRASNCFLGWKEPSTSGAFGAPCPSKVSLVKEMDWAAVRRAIGWSTP